MLPIIGLSAVPIFVVSNTLSVDDTFALTPYRFELPMIAIFPSSTSTIGTGDFPTGIVANFACKGSVKNLVVSKTRTALLLRAETNSRPPSGESASLTGLPPAGMRAITDFLALTLAFATSTTMTAPSGTFCDSWLVSLFSSVNTFGHLHEGAATSLVVYSQC